MALARFGLGGAQLDGPWFSTAARRSAGAVHEFRSRGGSQKFSWVHLTDVFGVIRFLRSHPEISGVVNLSSPTSPDNCTLLQMSRAIPGMPLGAPALGWVLPERPIAAGDGFEYPELRPAVRNIVGSHR